MLVVDGTFSTIPIVEILRVFCSHQILIVVKMLITFQIFVRLLHLIAQNVAELSNFNSGIRVRVRGSRAKDVSRGSVTGLKIV